MFDYLRANPTKPPINPYIFCLIFDHDIPSYSHCGGFIAPFRGEKITQLSEGAESPEGSGRRCAGRLWSLGFQTGWWFQNSFNQRLAVDSIGATSTEMFNGFNDLIGYDIE